MADALVRLMLARPLVCSESDPAAGMPEVGCGGGGGSRLVSRASSPASLAEDTHPRSRLREQRTADELRNGGNEGRDLSLRDEAGV